MVTPIIITIIICITVLVLTYFITKHGITVHYDKRFTIDDKRGTNFKPEELVALEKRVNPVKPQEPINIDEDKQQMGSMGAVIQNLQELFGPDSEPKNR